MPLQPFRAEVAGDADQVVVTLHGDINVSADDGLAAAYAEAAAREARVIVLDFGATDYINSTGIALIVRFLSDARGADRDVRAMGLSPHYTAIFRITRLSDYMHIQDTDASEATDGPDLTTSGGDR